MLKIGITGGIGSGKTYVSNLFNLHYKIPVYNSDLEAKRIMNTNQTIIHQLIDWYGNSVYFNNELNRKFLADIIFNNKEELKK